MSKQMNCLYEVDEKESVHIFLEAVIGKRHYDNKNESIAYWEDFLTFWLKGKAIEDVEMKMALLFHTFQPLFSVKSPLYRGMQLIEGETLSSKHYASFSVCEEVAKQFAGYSQKFGRNIRPEARRFYLAVQPGKALDLCSLLKVIETKTANRYLQIEIEDREWECEVIAPLTEEMLKEVVEFQLPNGINPNEKGAKPL